jgi:lysozyme
MPRALPLLLALGAGLALLTFSRRASASAPVFISDIDGYETQQTTAPAPLAAPLLDLPAWGGDWSTWAEPPIWGTFPDPEIPLFPLDLDQWESPIPGIVASGDPYHGGDVMPTQQQADTNLSAFLHAIRWAEGTSDPDGYRRMFGGALFDDFSDHPRIAHQFTNQAGQTLWTTAAGAYQFLAISPLPSGGTTRANTWDRMQARLGLPDFSPQSQDAAAVELIREAGALDDVLSGYFTSALTKVRGIWASLPGAGYSQPERPYTQLASVYQSAGGALAA